MRTKGCAEGRGCFKAGSAIACALLLIACGDEDESYGCVAPRGCDITQQRCQAAVFAATACERMQEGAPLPSIRTQSVADFRRQQAEELDAESASTAAGWEATLKLLRFLPEGKGLIETYLDMLADGVAAYYSEDEKRITILERDEFDPVNDVFVLSHEFVHSLQDTDVGLHEFTQAHVNSTDSSVAVRSLIEGEATIASFAVVERAHGRPPERAGWEQFENNLISATREDFSSSESPFLLGYQILPYAYGYAALHPRWVADETRQLREFYADPHTTLADLALGQSTGVSLEQPLDCYLTEPPVGFVADDHDRFGLLAPMAHERTFTGTIGADPLWRGDSVVIFRAEAGDGFAAAWTVRWRDAPMAAEFAGRVRGRVPDARVTERGAEVDVLVATDPAVVTSWSPGCGSKESLPPSGPGGTENQASRLTEVLSRLRLR